MRMFNSGKSVVVDDEPTDQVAKVTKDAQGLLVAEPQQRLIPARSAKLVYYKVWMPWTRYNVRGEGRSIYGGLMIEMSHDGEHWQPAYFPHVSGGYSQHCMQVGRWRGVSEKDPVACITDYAVRYIMPDISAFWKKAFSLPGRTDAMYARGIDKFMQGWERTSLEEIQQHLKNKYDEIQSRPTYSRSDWGY